jgi:hypothetical protein
MTRDLPTTAASLDALEAVATRYGLGLYAVSGLGMRGWLLQEQGAHAPAIELLDGAWPNRCPLGRW